MNRRRAIVLLPLLTLFLALLAPALPAAAHANLARSEPVAGSPNPVAPTAIRLFFTEPLELKYSELTVYDATRQVVSQGRAQAVSGDPLAMTVAVSQLPEGFYTVVWRANSSVDGHTTAGSFAFAVGSTPPPAASTFGDISGDTEFVPPTPAEIITKWLMILAATTAVGALGMRLLVWLPTLRGIEDEEAVSGSEADHRVARRLIRLVGVALIILTLATAVGVILQAAKVTNRAALAALDNAILADFLFNTRTGAIWSARLLLPLVALMLLGPLLASAFRGERRAAPDTDDDPDVAIAPVGPLAFGLALGLGYLLTISLISHAAAAPFWVPFTIALDFLHLVGTAVWVGGLIGLALTAPLVRDFGAATRPVLAGIVVRFSNIATLSVIVLAVSGLYSSWLHVGSLDALARTAYGRALTIKLVLFAALVSLGAFNHFWLRPRLAAPLPQGATKRAAALAEWARTLPIVGRQFGRTVRVEAILGVAIILAVAFMTGFVPAREAIVEARAPKRTQTLDSAGLTVTLTLAALQPGDNNFDVALKDANGEPVTNAERVALRLTHREMDMGEAEAIAESRGDGHYVASGAYLSMSGQWDIRVIVRRPNSADFDQTFAFPIGATANLAAIEGQLTAPQLPRLNSLRGIGFVALGLGLILAYFGARLFRRGSGFGTALLMLVPTALVVGSYLIYSGEPDEVVFNRPAEPTNPTVADAASIARGQALFASNCVVCHGAAGRGDGPQAATLNPRPPDLSQPHTAYHSDGYLYNAIRDGFPGSAMPAWGDTFTDPEMWDLVNYARQFNRLTANGATPPPFTSLPTAIPPGGAVASPSVAATIPPAATPAVGAPATLATARAATAAPGGEGQLIHAFNGAIWAINPDGGAPKNLMPTLARDAYAGDPALSPDGTTIAYTVVVIPAPSGTPTTAPIALPGSDLWLMDRDGGNARQVYKHDKPGVLIQSVVWAADGKALLYAYTAPLLGSDGRYVGTAKEIQRLDLATGARTRIVENGQDPAISPVSGAGSFAYVIVDPQTLLPSLWLASADGSSARELVGAASQFVTLSGPRFAPDGKSLVFAASGGKAAEGETPRVATAHPWPERLARWLIEPLFPQSAAAHGPPADLWLLTLNTGALSRLTILNGDDPLPAWSPDGRRLAFLTGAGLYILDLDAPRPIGATSPGLKKISERGASSSLIWSAR